MKKLIEVTGVFLIFCSAADIMGGFIVKDTRYMIIAIYCLIVGLFVTSSAIKWPDPPKKRRSSSSWSASEPWSIRK